MFGARSFARPCAAVCINAGPLVVWVAIGVRHGCYLRCLLCNFQGSPNRM